MLDADPSALYLDVRTEREFEAGHPAGAVNIPAFVAAATGGLEPNPKFVEVVGCLAAKDRPIFCGCQAGQRSQAAAERLLQAGFTNVTNVLGGFGGGRDPRTGAAVAGWRQAGLPVSTSVSPEASYATWASRAGV